MKYKSIKNSGFTLLELSIVLIIIGSLVASVNFGSSLIKQAKLKTVITEMTNYKAAILAFKDQYEYYPGDIPNFSSYMADTNACITDVVNPLNTCNGNGNFNIEDGGSSRYEDVRAHQHLSLAKLIPGEFVGVEASSLNGGSARFELGLNTPRLKGNPKAGIKIETISTTNPIFENNGHILRIGGVAPVVGIIGDGAFTARDAYAIDLKIDNGFASTGQFMALTGNNLGSLAALCVSAFQSAPSADYYLNTDVPACQLIYWIEKNSAKL